MTSAFNGPRMKRIGLVLAFVAFFALLNYKLFIAPARSAAKTKHVPPFAHLGRVAAGTVDDPNHGDMPGGFQFDPRFGLSEKMLQEEVFIPGYNLTRQMMKHAWDGYRTFAWGHDELRPLDKNGITGLGRVSIGLTLIDSLDTLMLMNMQEEFLEARDYIFDHVSFDQEMNVSMFEANIRIVGGLLSAFALSGDGRFVSKAYDMASRFLANFETVFPDNSVDLMKRLTMSDAQIRATPKAFEGERAVNIAQAGTLSLEFAYLSHIIKDPVFKERALGVIEALSQMSTTKPGLYPITIFPHLKAQPDDFYTVGGMGDSFYEYLFKYWVMTNKKDEMHLKMWNAAVNGIKEHLIQVRNRRSYIVQLHRGEPEPVMEHLACYLPGTLALAAYHQGNDDLLALAADLTDTCYQMYHRQAKGISPEKCKVPGLEPVEDQKHYLLRPEVVESIFLMWRVTRDIKYRQWGYEIALAIEKHCKISGGGYAGLADVSNTNNLAFNDRQESFFLAETLKYLFLLFGPDDVLPIDKWIFNTEAHPLPIIFH